MCDRVVNTPLTFITISDTLQNAAKKSTVKYRLCLIFAYLQAEDRKLQKIVTSLILASWLVPSSLEPNVHNRFVSLFSSLHLLISSDIFSKFFSQNSFSVYNYHCVKSDRICSFSGAYFPALFRPNAGNTGQKNSEYRYFSGSVILI